MSKIKFNFGEKPMMTSKKEPLVKVGLYMYTLTEDENYYRFSATILNEQLSRIVLGKEIKSEDFVINGEPITTCYCELKHIFILNANNSKRKKIHTYHTVPVKVDSSFSKLLGNTIKSEQESLNPF